MTASAATTGTRVNGWQWLLLALLCLYGTVAEAVTRVRVLAAPPAAVTALRGLAGDIEWLTGDGAAIEAADLTLVWQADIYPRSVNQFPQQPILLLAQNPAGLSARSQDAVLFWGPSLAQQVQLARQISPGLQRIGILYRQTHRAEIDTLLQSAAGGILARAIDGPPEARDVAELAQRTDILIASNDDLLFNRDSAKLVLLTAYRHQRAWIGPTPAFVTAGALATRAVAKDVLLGAIVDKVRFWQKQRRLGAAQQLPADEVVCNQQVARSLGLSLAPAVGCQAGRKE